MRKHCHRKQHIQYPIKMFGQIVSPQLLAQLKARMRPIAEHEIKVIARAIPNFIKKSEEGTADFVDFELAADELCIAYLLADKLISLGRLSRDEDTDTLLRLELNKLRNKLLDWGVQILEDIQDRFARTGKWGLTADEISKWDELQVIYVQLLSIADYGHWVSAYELAQIDIQKKRGHRRCR